MATRRCNLAWLLIPMLALGAAGAHAGPAPKELYNKTVLVTWATDVVQRAADGRVITPRVVAERQIYVSTAGRLFVRSSRSVQSGRRRGTSDLAPGTERNRAGEVHQTSFDGGRLVHTLGFESGAARLVVSFDPAYRTCSTNVVYGKLGGAQMRRKGLDGVMYNIESMNVVTQSCQIQDGNVFAGQ